MPVDQCFHTRHDCFFVGHGKLSDEACTGIEQFLFSETWVLSHCLFPSLSLSNTCHNMYAVVTGHKDFPLILEDAPASEDAACAPIIICVAMFGGAH